jgi:hypothetical protein
MLEMIAMTAAARRNEGRARERVDGRAYCLDWENRIHERETAT